MFSLGLEKFALIIASHRGKHMRNFIFEVGAEQTCSNLVDLDECGKMSLFSLLEASVQPRTDSDKLPYDRGSFGIVSGPGACEANYDGSHVLEEELVSMFGNLFQATTAEEVTEKINFRAAVNAARAR